MKTNKEIETEARHLMRRGRQYRDEQGVDRREVATAPLPRMLVQFTKSGITAASAADAESQGVHAHRCERYVEAAMEGGELIYRLMEREMETTGAGRLARENVPAVVMISRSGFDLLHAGYELVEEERLAELLEPYAERSENPDSIEPADEKTVAEVEVILETNLLPHSDRVRTRAEITEFLEGRLEPSVFIAHAIERQCARDNWRERMTERHEIKLTIDEP